MTTLYATDLKYILLSTTFRSKKLTRSFPGIFHDLELHVLRISGQLSFLITVCYELMQQTFLLNIQKHAQVLQKLDL